MPFLLFASLTKDAMADQALRNAVNVAEAPALSRAAFTGYRQKTIVGINVEVSLPLGDYDSDKPVNFGANRWGIATEIRVSQRLGRFILEGAASYLWFSDDNAYVDGSTLQQDIIYLGRLNLLFHFKRHGNWLGIGSMYLSGGSTTIDGMERNDLQIKSAHRHWPERADPASSYAEIKRLNRGDCTGRC